MALLAVGGATLRASEPGPLAPVSSAVPVALAAAFSSSLAAQRPAFAARVRRGALVARGGGLRTAFAPAGPDLRAGRSGLSLRLTAVGRGDPLTRVGPAVRSAKGSRVSYRRSGVEEWYVNGPLGLEQGFTLARRAFGRGELTLAVRAAGLRPRLSASGVAFTDGLGRTRATYSGLFAVDVDGKALPTRLDLSESTVLLRVDDAGARYPVTVDPFIQQGEKLAPTGEAGASRFGFSVALSADGDLALIGGPNDGNGRGAVWVFTRSGATWSQSGGKLTGGVAEAGNGYFGSSVALSADGTTALIGGSDDAGFRGSIWVFTRTGASWAQQGLKMTGTGAVGSHLGWSVALSADGDTALVGGPDDGTSFQGAAWVFVRNGTAWTQQGSKLTGVGGVGTAVKFGVSVALSADGNTALIGGALDNGAAGAAWVFTRAGGAWAPQGGKLGGIAGQFGAAVALSGDGNTAFIGAPQAPGGGAASVFSRTGTAWAQAVPNLTGGVSSMGDFGESVALTPDGRTALIGGLTGDAGTGAVWTFARTGATWTRQDGELTGAGASSNSRFGLHMALSSDGKTALVGAPFDRAGSAWAFTAEAPVVTGIAPATGPAAGGSAVTIRGSNLSGATGVRFGSSTSALVKVISDGELRAVAPAGKAGTVDLTVVGPNGTSATTAAGRFTYTETGALPPKPAAVIVARIVSVKVVGHGKLRKLDLRIRISTPGKARLTLLRRGTSSRLKTFTVRGGGNRLKTPVAARVAKGTYKLRIGLSDTKGHKRTYTTSVRVPM